MKVLKFTKILLLVFLIACSEDSSTSPEQTVSIKGNTYYNGVLGFSLKAPNNWNIEMNKDISGIHVLLFGTKSGFAGIAPTFSVISSGAGEMKSASELLKASQSYISQRFTDVAFEKELITNIHGIDCGELVYNFEFDGMHLQQKQVLFLCNEKVSVSITFTCMKNNYDSTEQEFDLIKNSLKLL